MRGRLIIQLEEAAYHRSVSTQSGAGVRFLLFRVNPIIQGLVAAPNEGLQFLHELWEFDDETRDATHRYGKQRLWQENPMVSGLPS
jgi:hypothetical protein